MLGLDPAQIKHIDPDLAIRRLRVDVRSDFIFSPHFDAVYSFNHEALWDRLRAQLEAGRYEPSLPIILEVPRESGITRPGAILKPLDRLLYQCLVDNLAPIAFQEIDPARSFGNSLAGNGLEEQMFDPGDTAWASFSHVVQSYCQNDNYNWAVRADVSAYFENIDQHVLINFLSSSGCNSSVVRCLEELLLSWSGRSSRGIPQGVFPSDFLGNLYLCGLDAKFQLQGVPSARYIDDIYLFYPTYLAAKKGLADLCKELRIDKLHLNERKTRIFRTNELLHEETRLDDLLQEAREAAEQDAFSHIDTYVLHAAWNENEDSLDLQEVDLEAFERLFDHVKDSSFPSDKIERLCLPFLAAVASDSAVDYVLDNYVEKAHQAKVYATYLAALARSNHEIQSKVEEILLSDDLAFDWQRMWLAAAVWRLDAVSDRSVWNALQLIDSTETGESLKAILALVVAKHGTAKAKRVLRGKYDSEPSPYVRSALVYATQYFPPDERRACRKAWSGHSIESSLIVEAAKQEGRSLG